MNILEIELKTLSDRFVDKIKDHDGAIYLVDGNGKRKFKIERIKTTSSAKSSSGKSSTRASNSSGSGTRGGTSSRSTSSRNGSGKSNSGKSRKGSNPLDDITRFVNRLPQK